MNQPFISFGAPDLREDDIQEVVRTLREGWIGKGPRVAAFESRFAAYQGLPAERAAAVSSCTAALHLSLVTAGIGAGDEVITTPLTFCATVNTILHTGATPVLCDVDAGSMNIDMRKLRACVTDRTRALLPVHFAGRPCEMDELLALARERDLVVIEDCAHAIEARYRGAAVGTLGDFGCFSFYPTKNLTTGEGGMVLARSPAQLARVRRLSLHGMTQDAWQRHAVRGFGQYDVVECGFKYNMIDLEAALGLHQLQRLESGLLRRQAIWLRYQQAFAAVPAALPAPAPPHMRHAMHLYTLLLDEEPGRTGRDDFVQRMATLGVGVGIHYKALPEHSYYREKLGWRPEQTPVASAIGRRCVSLPLNPGLTDGDVERVISAVCTALQG